MFGLRSAVKFFRDGSVPTLSGGFRNPDVRYYDMQRTGGGYRLAIHFEGDGLNEGFHIATPSVEIDDEFLTKYDEP